MWKQYTILIVDDEPFVLDELQTVLTLEGFTVITATSGEEGLRLLEHIPAKLVIADQKMPTALSGTEFLTQAKARYSDIVTMILSAFSEPEYLLDAVNEADVYHYALKPWDQTDLLDRISQALQFYHAQVEHRRLAQANAQSLKKMARMENFSIMGEMSIALYERFFPVLEASMHEETHKLKRFGTYSPLSGKRQGLSHLGTVVSRLGQLGTFYQQPTHFRQCSVLSLVQNCVREAKTAAEQLDIQLEWIEEYASELPDLLIQPETLSCAIKALIENAVVFNNRPNSDPPRHVFITVYGTSEPEHLVRIEVQDNGPGVNPQEQDKIFFPLYSTIPPQSAPWIQPYELGQFNFSIFNHMGLGLSIAQWCLTQHDGSLELVNPGEPGALFQATIPVERSDLRQQFGSPRKRHP